MVNASLLSAISKTLALFKKKRKKREHIPEIKGTDLSGIRSFNTT
jgi:hypothetical protein